jgi:hypothetical protein
VWYLVSFTDVKLFPEARGSLKYFSVSDNFDGSDIRNTATVCRYEIASYFETLLCKLFDIFGQIEYQSRAQIHAIHVLLTPRNFARQRLAAACQVCVG